MLPLIPLLLPVWWAGLIGLACGLALWLLGRHGQQAPLRLLAFPSAALIAWGLAWMSNSWGKAVLLPSYGLILGAGLLVAYRWLVKRLQEPLRERDVLICCMIALPVALVTGRLWYLAEFWQELHTQSPAPDYWNLHSGGLVFYGCVLGAGLTVLACARYWRWPLAQLADAACLPALLAIAIGRLACFANGCCYGSPSTLPWAMPQGAWQVHESSTGLSLNWQQQYNSCLHPTQFYESAVVSLLLIGLYAMQQRFKRPGLLAACAACGYALWRVCNESLRGDNNPDPLFAWTACSRSQLTSLLIILIAGTWACWQQWQQRNPPQSGGPHEPN